MEEVNLETSPSKTKNTSILPTRLAMQTESPMNGAGATPSPVIRRFSSSDMMLPSTVSPRAGNGVNSLVFMNRNSDFTRTVYEIDNGLLKQIRSSVKSKLEPPTFVKQSDSSDDVSSTNSGEAAIATPSAPGQSTMERPSTSIPPPNFVAESPIPVKHYESVSKPSATKSVVGSEDDQKKKLAKKEPKPPALGGHLMIKVGILLSRSSGRDKFCALLQYGAMFWGNQKVFAVSSARDAPWRNLEESMSAGRKTLRLFKWIKEFERMQRAYSAPDPGPHSTEGRTRIASILGFLMHTFSFAYYFIDNVIYCSQIGLINRPNVAAIFELRKMLKNGVSHEEYMNLQRKFRADEGLRQDSKLFESRLKDWKNYSSLLRLVFAIVYCSLQIDSAHRAEYVVKGDKTKGDKDKKKQLWELGELKDESCKEMIASVCNLMILLNRLQMGRFKDMPLWGVGALGMVAAVFGLDKNWPREKPVF